MENYESFVDLVIYASGLKHVSEEHCKLIRGANGAIECSMLVQKVRAKINDFIVKFSKVVEDVNPLLAKLSNIHIASETLEWEDVIWMLSDTDPTMKPTP